MAINSIEEYIEFFINLNMGKEVTLLRFVNNERMVLKQKLKNKINEKEPIEKAISVLEKIIKDNINPVWNQEFKLYFPQDIRSDPRKGSFWVSVYY